MQPARLTPKNAVEARPNEPLSKERRVRRALSTLAKDSFPELLVSMSSVPTGAVLRVEVVIWQFGMGRCGQGRNGNSEIEVSDRLLRHRDEAMTVGTSSGAEWRFPGGMRDAAPGQGAHGIHRKWKGSCGLGLIVYTVYTVYAV